MPFLGRRFRRRPSFAATLGLALLVLIAGRFALDYLWRAPGATKNGLVHEGSCRVVDVLDGQTLLVGQDDEPDCRVRLLGIEVDEACSTLAIEFLSSRTAGKSAELKFDKRRVDRQHRLLAYAYADNVLLNEELVREGFARPVKYPGDSSTIARRLLAAESDARRHGRGRWSPK